MDSSGGTSESFSSGVARAFREASGLLEVSYPSPERDTELLQKLIAQMAKGRLLSATFLIDNPDPEFGPIMIGMILKDDPTKDKPEGATIDLGKGAGPNGSGTNGYFQCPKCGKNFVIAPLP